MNSVGSTAPRTGCCQRKQRLEADNLAGRQVNLWLVHHAN